MKIIIYFFLNVLLFIPIHSFGHDASYILKNRMKQINNFHACFIQKISDITGKTIQSGQGELWIKRPNFFYYHILSPEENFLISDGETLWFYVPVIKQATAFCLKNSINNNFFLKFLFDYDLSEYKKYNVIQKKNWFHLQPILHDYSNLEEFKIKITDQGVIDRIILIASNGQHVDYYLSKQSTQSIDTNKFSFILTEDVQLDDQRK